MTRFYQRNCWIARSDLADPNDVGTLGMNGKNPAEVKPTLGRVFDNGKRGLLEIAIQSKAS